MNPPYRAARQEGVAWIGLHHEHALASAASQRLAYNSQLTPAYYQQLLALLDAAISSGDLSAGSAFNQSTLLALEQQAQSFAFLPTGTSGSRVTDDSFNYPLSLLLARFKALQAEVSSFTTVSGRLLDVLSNETALIDDLLAADSLAQWSSQWRSCAAPGRQDGTSSPDRDRSRAPLLPLIRPTGSPTAPAWSAARSWTAPGPFPAAHTDFSRAGEDRNSTPGPGSSCRLAGLPLRVFLSGRSAGRERSRGMLLDGWRVHARGGFRVRVRSGDLGGAGRRRAIQSTVGKFP